MATNPYLKNTYLRSGANPYLKNPYQTAKQVKETTTPSPLSDKEKVIKSLSSQKENYEKRLIAAGIDESIVKASSSASDPTSKDKNTDRLFNLTEDQGLLMDFFEIISRPTEAVKGLIMEGGEGAARGWSGKEVYKGSDMLGGGGFAADLAADILLDPINMALMIATMGGWGAGMAANAAQKALTVADKIGDTARATKAAASLAKARAVEAFFVGNKTAQAAQVGQKGIKSLWQGGLRPTINAIDGWYTFGPFKLLGKGAKVAGKGVKALTFKVFKESAEELAKNAKYLTTVATKPFSYASQKISQAFSAIDGLLDDVLGDKRFIQRMNKQRTIREVAEVLKIDPTKDVKAYAEFKKGYFEFLTAKGTKAKKEVLEQLRKAGGVSEATADVIESQVVAEAHGNYVLKRNRDIYSDTDVKYQIQNYRTEQGLIRLNYHKIETATGQKVRVQLIDYKTGENFYLPASSKLDDITTTTKAEGIIMDSDTLEPIAIKKGNDTVYLKDYDKTYKQPSKKNLIKWDGQGPVPDNILLDANGNPVAAFSGKVGSDRAAELGALETANKWANKEGYIVKVNNVNDRFEDIVVYKQVTMKLSNGVDHNVYVKVGEIEAKNVQKSAFFANWNYGDEDNLFAITSSSDFSKSEREAIEDMKKRLNERVRNIRVRQEITVKGVTIEKGDTLPKIIKKFKDNGKTFNMSDLEQIFGDEVFADFNKFLTDWGQEMYGVMYIAGNNVNKFVNFKDIKEMVDFQISVVKGKNGVNRVRFGFDIKKKPDGSYIDEFMNTEDIGSRMFGSLGDDYVPHEVVTGKKQKITVIDVLSEQKGLVGGVGRSLRWAEKVVSDITNKLNIGKSLARKLQIQLANISGEQAEMIDRIQRVLNNFAKQANEIGPDTLDDIAKLMEYGIEIDPVTGAIKYMFRNDDTKKVLLDMLPMLKKGKVYGLRRFNNAALADQFEAVLDQIFEGKVVLLRKANKNGIIDYGLRMADGADFKSISLTVGRLPDQLDDTLSLIKYGEPPQAIKDTLNIDLLRNNPELVNGYRDTAKEMLITLREAGVEIPPEMFDNPAYVRHILTDEAVKFRSSTRPIIKDIFALPGKDMFDTRGFTGTIDEINSSLKTFNGAEFDTFDTNIHRAVSDLLDVSVQKLGQEKTMRAILQNAFGEEGDHLFLAVEDSAASLKKASVVNYKVMEKGNFGKQYSRLYKNLSKGTRKAIDDFFAELGTNIDGPAILVHKRVGELLTRLDRTFVEVDEVVKGFDKIMAGWKSITLATPGFHMRNFFGNMFNSAMVGMNAAAQVKYIARASRDFTIYKNILARLDAGETVDALSRSDALVYRRVKDFLQSGISQINKGVRDLEIIEEMILKGKAGNQIARLDGMSFQKVIAWNFNAAEAMDNFQRYALYQWALEEQLAGVGRNLDDYLDSLIKGTKTMDNQAIRFDAMSKVKQSLFDYSDLTQFERDFMKRVFPFYTFMKNNFVFHFQNIMTNPAAYRRAGYVYKDYLENLSPVNTDELPEYAVESMWVPLPMEIGKDDEQMIAFLRMNLPITDFTELVENPFKKGVNSLAMPLKIPIELGMNADSFTGAPIVEFPGAVNRMDDEEGFAAAVRSQKGNVYLTGNPIVQKVADDLGMRVPRNYISIAMDILDGLTGYQGGLETFTDVLDRLGLAKATPKEKLDINRLYQDLQYLRDLKSLYEQNSGSRLPSLKDFGIE